MESDRFHRVMHIFGEALALPDSQRGVYLDQAAEGDADLRHQVERMLALDAAPEASFGGRGEGMYMLAEQIALQEESRGGGSSVTSPDGAFANTVSAQGVPVLQGRYRILRKIGEGGMGVVYEAEQLRPRRTVALKAIRPGIASRDTLRRFEYEAHVLGRLQHPNIAQIYDAGAADETRLDQAFFAMEFINGLPLTEHAKVHMLSVRDKLALLCKVCDAVHHAHQRGVIHRDLKPSNILVNEIGEPKILDFGVAQTESDPTLTTMHTIPGQLVGTLAYMSPEQVLGDPSGVDHGTDIYALGVILYQLLTGTLPHDLTRCSLPRAAQVIREEEPKSLGEHDRLLRGDLDLIVKTAMAKDRTQRYRSAAELAEDMRRFLDGRPVLARQESAIQGLRRQVRQYRAGVALGLAACMVLTAAALYGFIQRARERAANRAAESALALAEEAEDRANREAESLRESLYRSTIGFAHAAYLNKSLGRMRKLLDSAPEDLRQWEWHYLQGLTNTSFREVTAHIPSNARMAVATAAPVAVTMSQTGPVRVWNLTTGEELASCTRTGLETWIAINPEGTMAAIGAAGEVEIVELATCRARAVIQLDVSHIRTASFDRAGQRLAVVGSEAAVFDAQQSMQSLWRATDVPVLHTMQWSPDGSVLIAGALDGQVLMFDAATGERLWGRSGHSQAVRSFSFHPNGIHVASAGNDSMVYVWNVATGDRVVALQPHENKILALTYSLDGRYLLSGGTDSSIQITDTETYERVGQLMGHEWTILELGINIANGQLISHCRGGELRWWEIDDAAGLRDRMRLGRSVVAVAMNESGTRTAIAPRSQGFKVIDAVTRRELWTETDIGVVMHGLTFGSDDRLFASCHDRLVRCYDGASGSLLWQSTVLDAPPTHSELSPARRTLAVGGRDGFVRIFESDTGAHISTLGEGLSAVLGLQWIDDDHILLCDERGQLQRWSVRQQTLLARHQAHDTIVYQIVLLNDGQSCVTASEDGFARIWNLDSFALEGELKGHYGAIYSLAANSDGSRIATGGFDNVVRVWDARTKEELLTLTGHTMSVTHLSFSADGNTLLSANDDGTVRWWHARRATSR